MDREILAGNLHGVDLNPEPVEITKLSLWLKTAKRGKLLQDLEQSIKCGNSLIANKNEHGRAFDWKAEFPEIIARGGFDIVLGNPPYVRMETIKPFKPYLEKHYAVSADRADLYAYFYEKGFELLRPGGRLGYISSSTFLRTGSGENLRHYLRTRAEIETVVDFGDLQIFEGVTTYPAIVTMRRAPATNEDGHEGKLRFLNIKSEVPEDLSRTFRSEAQTMPRARLGDGSWQFEDDKLAALRAKIKAGRKTLGEVYGPPLYGIKTGLNEAFTVSRERRDELVARDARSAELLVPFLRGENIKRWRVESEDLFLINIPRGKVRIEDYPAIRDHLLPFKPALEARATKQEWFELQQAQLAYQEAIKAPKVIWPQFLNQPEFCFDKTGLYPINKAYFFSVNDLALAGYLNARVLWFCFVSHSVPKRGGYREATAQHISILPFVERSHGLWDEIGKLSTLCSQSSREQLNAQQGILRRLPDLCPPHCAAKLTNRLREWWKLDFKSFRAEIKKAFKADIPLKQRDEWENFLREEGEKIRRLTAEIQQAEREINSIVYKLFDLTPDEIALLESSLAGQY